ncbi:MAG: class I SAM-dependent methyltransferase [Chloroflexota bacterium]
MKTDTPGWISAHSEDDEDFQRWAAGPIQLVDFAIHIHYLQQYIRRGDLVLEVGAGGGRFTQEIATLTDQITVVDISPDKIERNRRNAVATGYADRVRAWIQADMCDLKPHLADGRFDVLVCYGGPLSYVFDRREKAISELVRVTKPGGLLLLSARSLWGTVHEFLPTILHFDPRINREIVATGDMGPTQVALATRFWHAYRAAEFKEFIEAAGTTVILQSASDCLSATWRDMLAAWQADEGTWKHLLELEIMACREPGALDMGNHVFAVARKR